MTRLELAGIRICERCGRGRAELAAADGRTLDVPLDAARTRELAAGGRDADVPWLSRVVLELLASAQYRMQEIVLDRGEHGLRALATLSHDGATEVVACTPQEGVGLAVRAGVPLYATAEALAPTAQSPATDRILH